MSCYGGGFCYPGYGFGYGCGPCAPTWGCGQCGGSWGGYGYRYCGGYGL